MKFNKIFIIILALLFLCTSFSFAEKKNNLDIGPYIPSIQPCIKYRVDPIPGIIIIKCHDLTCGAIEPGPNDCMILGKGGGNPPGTGLSCLCHYHPREPILVLIRRLLPVFLPKMQFEPGSSFSLFSDINLSFETDDKNTQVNKFDLTLLVGQNDPYFPNRLLINATDFNIEISNDNQLLKSAKLNNVENGSSQNSFLPYNQGSLDPQTGNFHIMLYGQYQDDIKIEVELIGNINNQTQEIAINKFQIDHFIPCEK